MKAIVQRVYGPPELLALADVDAPVVGDDDVLVRVRASSVNAMDWHGIRGDPLVARPMMGGWRRPKSEVLGNDAAGIVEAVGRHRSDLKPGDEVFGTGRGAWAELTAGKRFVPKPGNLTFEQAAALPVAGITALQAVRDHAAVQAGQHVLVTGAGGGVGSFAVQIAGALGADVTAMTSTDKLAFVHSIGARTVLDYRRQDLPAGRVFDAIVDVGGRLSISRLRRALKPGGKLVLVGASPGHLVGPFKRIVAAAIRSRLLRQRVIFFVASITEADLAAVGELASTGRIAPVIGRTYPLVEAPAAVGIVEMGTACGKVVITLG